MSENKKDDDLKRARVAGESLAGLGAVVTGLGHIDKIIKNDKYKGSEKSIKTARTAGPMLIASGVTLAGFSAYKHWKDKKKESDNPKK